MATREYIEGEKKVRFGRIGRTLEYEDADGALLFTFDLGSHDKALELGRGAIQDGKVVHSSWVSLARDCAKRFLESCGYEVQ
jgi:hypothetical protein